jgi:hypothetical protein
LTRGQLERERERERVRKEFEEVFSQRFGEDTTHSEQSFSELFPLVPSELAKHNQPDFEGESSNSSDTNHPEGSIGFLSQPITSQPEEQENQPTTLATIPTIQPIETMSNKTPMPAARHHTAPKFSSDQPRELQRYFEELNNLFGPAGITEDVEKKSQTVRYLDVDQSDLWKGLKGYSDREVSYEDWKEEVINLYPGADEKTKWTMSDLDKLVGERARLGIYNLADLGAYYRVFLMISSFLLNKGKISEAEQSRAFVRGFSTELWERIGRRLEIRVTNHVPDDHWDLNDIKAAGEYVLHGTAPTALPGSNYSEGNVRELGRAGPSVKAEPTSSGLAVSKVEEMFEKFAQTIVTAVASRNRVGNTGGTGSTGADGRAPGNCNFCGELGHFIPNCKEVERYEREGKIKKNPEGRIVLVTGAWISRTLKGNCLMEKVDEWHRINPGNIAAAVMSAATTVGSMMYNCVPNVACKEYTSMGSLEISYEDEIAVMEHRLLAMKEKRYEANLGMRTRARAKGADLEPIKEVSKEAEAKGVETGSNKENRKETVPKQAVENTQVVESREHPFANLPEGNYAPPTNRNFAALPDKPSKDREPGYRTEAPVQRAGNFEDIFKRALNSKVITMSVEEFLAFCPEAAKKMREITTPRKVIIQDMEDGKKKAGLAMKFEVNTMELPFMDAETKEVVEVMTQGKIEEVKEKGEVIQEKVEKKGKAAYFCPDPFDAFLGRVDQPLSVARESHALRAIMLNISGLTEVESIVDPGCQIVAMSEFVCHDLGLAYDPTIQLNMQSANGETDRSLGLIRNVACTIAGITVYLQIHVIREPAYDILLGRPFDVVTESVVRNYANSDQTITIRDPNEAGRIATIPTIARGSRRHIGRTGICEGHSPYFRPFRGE